MASPQVPTRFEGFKRHLTIPHREIDIPLVQVDQLERLSCFKPEAVDWIISQAQVEADFRRKESQRVNSLVFVERLMSQLCALLIGGGAILGGSFVALHGQPWAGTTIAGAAITGLAIAFISGRKLSTKR